MCRFLQKTVVVVPEDQAPAMPNEKPSCWARQIEFPAACFQIACKCVEIFAPRLIDVCDVLDGKATAGQLREAENIICRAVEWQIDVVTGVLDAWRCSVWLVVLSPLLLLLLLLPA